MLIVVLAKGGGVEVELNYLKYTVETKLDKNIYTHRQTQRHRFINILIDTDIHKQTYK